MFAILSFSALAGLFSKLADEASEGKWKVPIFFPFAAAILYGLLAGYLTSTTALSSLFLALAVSAALARKIDHWLHLLGLSIFALVLLLTPLHSFDVWVFSLFLVLGLLDELELRLPGLLGFLNHERLWVPLGAVLIGLWSGVWLYLAAILAFDIFYRLAGWVAARKTKKPETKKKRRRQ